MRYEFICSNCGRKFKTRDKNNKLCFNCKIKVIKKRIRRNKRQ